MSRALQILRSTLFLRFTLAPIAMLLTMNGLLDLFISDIGGVESNNYSLAQRYEILEPDIVVLSAGRFRFMTFFLVATILYPALIVFSLFVISRHVRSCAFLVILTAGIATSSYWIYSSLLAPSPPISTILLFSITEEIALSRYDPEFAYFALTGARVHFALALVGTLLALLSGSCIMRHLDATMILPYEEVLRKRRDLKKLLFISSVFLTFVAVYVSEWLAWPASFVAPKPQSPFVLSTGDAEEILALASGLRLYFGTGYSLTLLAFAIPAIVTFSGYVERNMYKAAQAENEFLRQRVFSREEAGIVFSIAAPILVPLAGTAIGL